MRGAGRMGIAARLRERLLRGRGGFLRAKDLQGEASGVPDNGVKEQTRNLMEAAGGAEEATCALREADGVVRAKTRNLTETADGAEETGGALSGVEKGKTGAAPDRRRSRKGFVLSAHRMPISTRASSTKVARRAREKSTKPALILPVFCWRVWDSGTSLARRSAVTTGL